MSNVLRPVDVNVDRSPLRKRARYDDDLDEPNKNERWSLHKNEVVLHEVFDHGVGRLDCDEEEIFTDDDTIFCKTEPGAIDVSCASMTPNTRDKQLSILESTLTKESLDKLSLGEWDSILVTKPIIKPTDKTTNEGADLEAERAIRQTVDNQYFDIMHIHTTLFDSSDTKNFTINGKLPKLNVPSFNGDLKLWPTFRDIFEALILNNYSLIDIEKFQYLITALSGEPFSLIKSIPCTNANSEIVYKRLMEMYDNKRALAMYYSNAIMHSLGTALLRDTSYCFNHRFAQFSDYFDLLSDEVILYILRWLPKTYLMDIALVCKRFHRLTQDESLWTRMDISNRHLQAGELGKILSKQVVVLRLARSSVNYPPILPGVKAALSDFKSRLLYLDLSMAYISPQSLTILLSKCRRLKKLSLENVHVNDEVLIALSANKDIEVINFAMATGIMEDGLKYLLANCRKIRELNIAWTYMTAPSIQYICNNLPSTMDRLNFSGCRKLLTDKHVFDLVASCPRLRELDLSDCTSITGEAVERLTVLEDLNFLALSRCYLIPYKSLLYLKKIYNLSYLDIHGGYNDADELRTIQEGLGAKVQINKFKFSSIARPTVGMRRSSIWNMRVRD